MRPGGERIDTGARAGSPERLRASIVNLLRYCALKLCLGLLLLHPWAAARAAPVEVTQATVIQEAEQTIFTMTLSEGVPAEVFTLADPFRIVIDLPDVSFKLPPGTGGGAKGHVKVFRYGLFAEKKARVVIELNAPVKIASANITRASGKAVALKLVLEGTDAAAFAKGVGAGSRNSEEQASRPVGESPPRKSDRPARSGARPVVVIDAGHGGIDPGAIGSGGITEKAVVFDVAVKLKGVLEEKGGYDVKLTRSEDVFVSLDRRLKISAEFGADLFISLHADAIAETAFAESVRGATVYTLSDRASDERARKMAEKENASDLIAGLAGMGDDGADLVKDILYDLMRRETSNFSADFSNLLVSRLSKSIVMSRDPQRAAAFKVLRQAHAPSVLVELGYMSNSRDQVEMTTQAWQLKVAQSIASAVDSYFSKRTAVQP